MATLHHDHERHGFIFVKGAPERVLDMCNQYRAGGLNLPMVSMLIMTGALGLFLWELDRGASLESARTMAVSAIVVTEMFYLLNSRHILRSVLSREGLFGNRSVLVVLAVCALLQIIYVHTDLMQVVFHSTHLTLEEWVKVALVGAFVFAIAEVEKAIIRCFFSRSAAYRTSVGPSDRSISPLKKEPQT